MSEQETTALATTAQATELGFEFDQSDIGAGVGDIGAADIKMPFLAVLQSNSPQLKPGSEKQIIGASMGQFFNTATNKTLGDTINVVPVMYKRAVVEWKDRDSGGGWVGTHPGEYLAQLQAAGKTYKDEKGRVRLKSGGAPSKDDNVLVETGYFFMMVLDESGHIISKALLALSSTQWKAARTLNSLIASIKLTVNNQQVPAPMFSQVYTLATGLQRNNAGEWYGINVKHVGPVQSKETYEAAKKFREFAKTANITPVQDTDDDLPEAAGGNSEVGDDEIPF